MLLYKSLLSLENLSVFDKVVYSHLLFKVAYEYLLDNQKVDFNSLNYRKIDIDAIQNCHKTEFDLGCETTPEVLSLYFKKDIRTIYSTLHKLHRCKLINLLKDVIYCDPSIFSSGYYKLNSPTIEGLVEAHIKSKAYFKGYTYTALHDMAEELYLSPTCVYNVVKRLKKKGIFEKQGRRIFSPVGTKKKSESATEATPSPNKSSREEKFLLDIYPFCASCH